VSALESWLRLSEHLKYKFELLLEAVSERWAGVPAAPFVLCGFELVREKIEGRYALLCREYTLVSGGDAESQEFEFVHRTYACAEGFKVDSGGVQHWVLFGAI
jgi:hypothetical protein